MCYYFAERVIPHIMCAAFPSERLLPGMLIENETHVLLSGGIWVFFLPSFCQKHVNITMYNVSGES